MKPHRGSIKEGTFFVTADTWQRRSLFASCHFAELFLDVLYSYRAQSKYALHEFVLMPDHFHLIITTGEHVQLDRAVQLIRGGFSHRARTELNSTIEIWQPGFTDHLILEEEDYENHRRYIHQNPVKRGLVEEAEEYPYSSAHPGFGLDPRPGHFRG